VFPIPKKWTRGDKKSKLFTVKNGTPAKRQVTTKRVELGVFDSTNKEKRR
jgi:hypothetical protein